MKLKTLFLGAALAAAAGALWITQGFTAPEPVPDHLTRWEYKVYRLNSSEDYRTHGRDLDIYGDQGWELVSTEIRTTAGNSQEILFYMKRSKE